MKARDDGLFDMSMLAVQYFRLKRVQADEFDERCARLLTAYRRSALARYHLTHTPIMKRPEGDTPMYDPPRYRDARLGSTQYYYSEDYVDVSFDTGYNRALDRAMMALWDLAATICTPSARLVGWAEGYHTPPDRVPRAWAADLRRKARKSRSRE